MQFLKGVTIVKNRGVFFIFPTWKYLSVFVVLCLWKLMKDVVFWYSRKYDYLFLFYCKGVLKNDLCMFGFTRIFH